MRFLRTENNTYHIKSIFITFLFSVIITILFITTGYFQKAVSDAEVCLACHEDMDLFMEKDGKKISLYVNPKDYKSSVHGGAACIDCHQGYNPDEVPHTKTKVKVNCLECHEKPKGLDESVHKSSQCSDCHGKHSIVSGKGISKNQTAACLKCHTRKNIQLYKTSIHGKKNTGCESCHPGGHSIKKLSKTEIADICGRCHKSHQRNFNNSIHQTVLSKGSPTCSDCHGSHQIIRSKLSIESQACLKCHLDETKFPGDEKIKGSAKFVQQYRTSIHASIEKNGVEAASCSDCHGNHGIQTPEDPSSLTSKTRLTETCGKCHKDIVEKFNRSAHGKSLKEKNVSAPTCVSCHSEHSINAVLSSDEFSKINQVEMCLDCHVEGKLPHKNYKGEEVLITHYKDSYHYKALLEGNLNSATCSDCHGSHEMDKYDDPKSRIYKKNIPNTCGQTNCHTRQLAEFDGSIHEVSLIKENIPDAPVCTDCHGKHQILKKDSDTNRISNPAGLIQLCSDCHNSVELVEKYNLPGGRTDSYLRSFHGLAVRGGSKLAANCESCHGYHNIRPSTDSLSTIHKKNLPETCGKCHPGAIEAFFSTPIHITNPREESPVLFWITRFYIVFIIVLIGGMVLHNALDFFKKVRQEKS